MFHQVITLSSGFCVNMSTVIMRLCDSSSQMLSCGFCVNMSTVIIRFHVLPSHYVIMWIFCRHANCYHEA